MTSSVICDISWNAGASSAFAAVDSTPSAYTTYVVYSDSYMRFERRLGDLPFGYRFGDYVNIFRGRKATGFVSRQQEDHYRPRDLVENEKSQSKNVSLSSAQLAEVLAEQKNIV